MSNVSIQASLIEAPRTYTFSILIDGVLLNETHDVIEANWDFGDGNTALDEFEPTHTYTSSGNYPVELEVIFGDDRNEGDQSSSSGGDTQPPKKTVLTTVNAD